jgi:Omp85 superfamily domain
MGAGSTNAAGRVVRAVIATLVLGSSAHAEEGASSEPARRTTLIAGAHYADVSRLHRFFFGEDYRDLWALPVQVEVLDLRRFAGGLTPVRRVGQQQSHGLALRGADGRSYTFRGIEKDATTGLEPDLRRSIAGRIAQDQIAALNPGAPPVAAALLDAAGVLNAEPRMVVMPDDALLGAFREDFAGVLGTIQEYPTPASDGHAGFAGATAIIDGKEMLARRRASPGDPVDARAFLRARLMDLFLGDWDRHLGQWRFARVPWSAEWQPIPEDRDFAFSRFEGSVLFIARNWRPRWVAFGDEYPDMLGLTWQAWPLDRLFLTELERPAWDEVTAELKRRLTDEVIDAAVRRLPPEYLAADGARMTRALKRRRDRLGDAADRFYRLLSEEVRVDGTAEPEAAEVVALDGGDLDVRLYRADPSGAPVGEPWFHRRFRHRETSEVRLDLRAGNDRAVVRGQGRIRVRVLGGEGDDVLDDSAGGKTWFADWQGRDRVVRGSFTKVDTRPYTAPVHDPERPWIPPWDWGRQRTYVPWFGASPDLGAFLGGGVRLERFAFRTHPYGRRQTLRAGFATGPRAFRLDYDGEFRRENSGIFLTLAARASQLELLRFFGFGNDTRSDQPDAFYRVKQRQLSLELRLNVPLAPRLTLSFGPMVQYAHTFQRPGTFVGEVRPYGSEDFGALGAAAEARLDTRNLVEAATRGVLLLAGGSFHPAAWNAKDHFGEVHAEAASYLTGALPLRPTLALRAGVKQVFGTYPFYEATFVGGEWTVRGFSSQRFAGDGGAWGNSELRLLLGRYYLVLPGEYGLFALADTGRVWLEGERSDSWHTGVGGGLWFAYVERTNTVTVAVVRSVEGTGFYLRAGFLF